MFKRNFCSHYIISRTLWFGRGYVEINKVCIYLFVITVKAYWTLFINSHDKPLVIFCLCRCFAHSVVEFDGNIQIPYYRSHSGDWSAALISVLAFAPGGRFKNTYELLNLRALKFSTVNKIKLFNVWVRYFVWNFKGTLWNSTQNILPIRWKIWFLCNIEILRALRFRSSYAFLKRPPGPRFNIR